MATSKIATGVILPTVAPPGYVSGLLFASAEEWRKVGAEHPFGEHYGGPSDIVPERYDRKTLEEAIAAVPQELIGHGFLWGSARLGFGMPSSSPGR